MFIFYSFVFRRPVLFQDSFLRLVRLKNPLTKSRSCYEVSSKEDFCLTAYPSGAPEITPSFWWGSCCLFLSFLCCVMCSIVCLFVFFHF